MNDSGKSMARRVLERGDAVTSGYDKGIREYIGRGASALEDWMSDTAEKYKGNDLYERLRQVDPAMARYMDNIAHYRAQPPTPGRGGGSRTFFNDIASAINPKYSEENYKNQDQFKDPKGNIQLTLDRSALMATAGQQIHEDLEKLAPEMSTSRWENFVKAYMGNRVYGDHRWSDLANAIRSYVQHQNVLIRLRGGEAASEVAGQLGLGPERGAPFAITESSTPGQILGLLHQDAQQVQAEIDHYNNKYHDQYDGQGTMTGFNQGAYNAIKSLADMDVDAEIVRMNVGGITPDKMSPGTVVANPKPGAVLNFDANGRQIP
jgi:hypothetical protein